MIALGVDPGKMTGLARWEEGWQGAWQMPQDQAMDWCDAYLGSCHASGFTALVACERFNVTQATVTKGTDAHWSLEQIGVLRHLCREFGHTFKLQGASDGKRFAKDDRLRALGWYTPTKGGHANDAARHLLLGLTEAGEHGPIGSITES